MDRHQEKDYEEGKVMPENGAASNGFVDANPMDDLYYFQCLIKVMRQTIAEGKGFIRWKLVDAEKCMLILDDLERNMPKAIDLGLQTYTQRDRIFENSQEDAVGRITTAEMRARATIEKANRDAERIIADATDEANAMLADAQERADYLVSQEEVLRRAQEEARDIKNDTTIQINEERLKAAHEIQKMLDGVEGGINQALDNIAHSRKKLENLSKPTENY